MEVNIENAQLTILLEIDGEVHLVGMSKDRLEAITVLIKNAIEVAISTTKTQKDLCDFLNYKR